MKQTLRDYLVFCDMDNTLLTAKEGIPFLQPHGHQAVHPSWAGGSRWPPARPPESIRAALGDIQLSLPAISCNGSLLYDFSTDTVLRRATLDRKQATLAIQDVVRQFRASASRSWPTRARCLWSRPTSTPHAHQVDEKITGVTCPLDSVPDGWVKVVFASDPGDHPQAVPVCQDPLLRAGKLFPGHQQHLFRDHARRRGQGQRPAGSLHPAGRAAAKDHRHRGTIITIWRSCRRPGTRWRWQTPPRRCGPPPTR